MKESFLEQLARPQPDPGGGAAAAYGAALGLALVEKIIHLEYGRHHDAADLAHSWRQLLGEIEELSADFSRLLKSDVEAYRQLVLARSSGNTKILADAIIRAIDCPMEIMMKARQAMELASRVDALCKQHLVADLLVATEFFRASLRGAHHIAAANVFLIESAAEQEAVQARLSNQLNSGLNIAEKALEKMLKRLSN